MEWFAPGLLGLVAIVVTLVAVSTISRLDAEREWAEETGEGLATARSLQLMVEVQSGAVRAFLLTREAAFLAEAERAAARIDSLLDSLSSRPASASAERILGRFAADQAAYAERLEAGLRAGIRGAGTDLRRDFLLREMAPLKSRLEASASRVFAASLARHRAAVSEAQAASSRGLHSVAITCLAGLLLASTAAFGHNRRLQRARRQRDEYLHALRSAKDNLSLAAEAGGIGIWDLDAESGKIFWSEYLWTMTGLPPDGPMSLEKVLGAVHPEDRETFRRAFQGAMDPAGPGEFELEHRILRPDGSVRWFLNKGKARFAPLKSGEGPEGGKRLERFRGAAVDVTERKLGEEALRASDERFHMLAKATNDAVYDWDISTGAIWWNEGVKTLFGFPPGKEGHDIAWWTSRIHPEDRERMEKSLSAAVAAGTDCWQEEYRFQCADGDFKIVYDRGFLIRDDQGACRRMIGAMMDLTAIRRAEEDLRMFRLLVEECNDYIAMADREGRCFFLNAGGRKMAGVEEEGLPPGKHIGDYLFEEDKELAGEIWSLAAREGQWQGELRIQHRVSGRPVPVLWNIFALQRPNGTGALAVAAIGRDITLLKQKEEDIRQGQKLEAIGQLAGGIAHDFNNILTVINGYGELLLRRFGGDDPDRSLLTVMLESGHRAANLTAQLLAYGRKQVLQPRILDLNAVVEETGGMLRSLVSEDIALDIRTARPLDTVRADPAQVSRILLNLGLNARDAMTGAASGAARKDRRDKEGRSGVLRIETGLAVLDAGLRGRYCELPPGRYVTVTVSDTGTGIPAEVQDHLFEPFFTTKSAGLGPTGRSGTGLGLSSTYGIIRQSGGGIEVHSEPGRGSTFRVYLPVVPEQRPASAPAAPGAPARDRTGIKGRILLVEDEEPVRHIARKLLEMGGYAVHEAGNGAEALSALADMDPEPDLILTDLMMPRMGGLKLAEEVRRTRPHIGILLMSGYPEEETASPGGSSPWPEWRILPKPFTSQDLLRAVEQALAHPVDGGG